MSDTITLLVVGDGPVAEALLPMAGLLGWECRAATELPEALAALPDADAVVVTSHHAEVDAPAIKAALAAIGSDAGGPTYLGGMGSRRTQARRREWLLANGVTEADLARVHGPAGIAIGADPAAGDRAVDPRRGGRGAARGRSWGVAQGHRRDRSTPTCRPAPPPAPPADPRTPPVQTPGRFLDAENRPDV